jgi:repressor LexA
MPPEITARQREVLDFIRDFIRERGFAPSHAEIARALDLRSVNAASQHVRLLVKKGALERTPGLARSLRLPEENEPTPAAESLGLPLVGEVAAGAPVLAEENVEARLPLSSSLFRELPDYLLRVRGDSMIEAGIRPGDLVAVRSCRQVPEGAIAVVRLDDAVTLKRWTRRGEVIVLCPENRDLEPFVVDPRRHEVAIEGLVVGLLRLSIESGDA